MIAFIDTSTLLKRYVKEENSDHVNEIFTQLSDIILSPITSLEIHSALMRKYRDKSLDKGSYQRALNEYQIDLENFIYLAFTTEVKEKAIYLIQRFGMKPLDSIQLAASLSTFADQFITSDKQLHDIAQQILEIECIFI